MHPDTEFYLRRLRYRLDQERGLWRDLSARTSPTALLIHHNARIFAHLHSLHDWPQPGRPA